MKNKDKKVDWFYYNKRSSVDFPFLIVYHFFIGQEKYLNFKNILYIGKYPTIYSYRSRKDLDKLYKKIERFKKNDFIKINKKTKEILKKLDAILNEINYKNLSKRDSAGFLDIFKRMEKILYEFTAYLILIQYIGRALPQRSDIIKFFDKEVITKIRFQNQFTGRINKKLSLFFKFISKKISIEPSLFFWGLPEEIKVLIKNEEGNQKIANIKKVLTKRKKNYCLMLKNGKADNFYNKNEIKNVEKSELKTIKEKKHKSSLSEIRGTGISFGEGKINGIVKIIFDRKDFKKIKRGDILVSFTVMPYYLPIIKKSKLFITDEGGLLTHPSIIARELKIPCVIGTKIATKVLKDGDLVEVDANKGVVKIIKKK